MEASHDSTSHKLAVNLLLSTQVHVMIEHCLLMRLDALQTELALMSQGVPRCMTRIGTFLNSFHQPTRKLMADKSCSLFEQLSLCQLN